LDRWVIALAFDIVPDGCQPLLAIDYEARSEKFLYVNLSLADVNLREREAHQNRVNECLLVIVCPHELTLEIWAKNEFAFVD
ncbi:MAG: hypothetical protein OJI67_24345, partial [Prosthecobacter sp.]|nr:hypothetical protein [Prosthecobacter sp.]